MGPEHAMWKESGRVRYTSVSDEEALGALQCLAETEGILPALETAHALAEACRGAASMPDDFTIVVNLSGRGDKDVMEVQRLLDRE